MRTKCNEKTQNRAPDKEPKRRATLVIKDKVRREGQAVETTIDCLS
jgi:hypothetical protein